MAIENINPGITPEYAKMPAGSPAGKPAETENTSPPPSDMVDLHKGTAPGQEKELTVLVYIHGQYKDLAKAKAKDFLQLENVGSNENVNVVAELGRAPQDDPEVKPFHIDGDWSGVRRYYVSKHDHSDTEMTIQEYQAVEQKIPKNPMAHYELATALFEGGRKEEAKAELAKAKELGMLDLVNHAHPKENKKIEEEYDETVKPYQEAHQEKQVYGSQVLEELPKETKIGDPSTLKDFVAWGMKNYPARHYVLVMTGHGGAWIGALEINPQATAKAIQEGAAEASKEAGKEQKLDALVFNSCYMGNLESSYEMRGAADVIIGSENYSKGTFGHWGDHLAQIEKRVGEAGEFDKKTFARDFIEYYRSRGEEIKENFPEYTRWKESFLTLTAVDTKAVENVAGQWKEFVHACQANKVPDNVIFKEFANSQGFVSSSHHDDSIFTFYDMIKDLGDIMAHVRENPTIPGEVKEQAVKVQQALKEAVIDEQHEGKDMDHATGLTIWAPSNGVDISLMAERYEKENVPDFVKSSGYLPFLKEGLAKADQQALKDFMSDMKVMKNIKKILADPSVELTDAERKVLKEGEKSIHAHAEMVKEKLDLTVAQVQTMTTGLTPSEPLMYGQDMRDFVDEQLQRARSREKGQG